MSKPDHQPISRAVAQLYLSRRTLAGTFRFPMPYPDGDPGAVTCRGCGAGRQWSNSKRLALVCETCDRPDPELLKPDTWSQR